MFGFFKDAYNEFKKVEWPTKNEAMLLTAYVIGVSLFVGLFVTAVDFGFKEVLSIFIG